MIHLFAMCHGFQVGIYAVFVRKLHIICATLVHIPYARDALKVQITIL